LVVVVVVVVLVLAVAPATMPLPQPEKATDAETIDMRASRNGTERGGVAICPPGVVSFLRKLE
jgi:hypothetical protein